MGGLLFLCFLLFVGGSVLAQDPSGVPNPPFDLQTSYLYNPIGIDTASPRLSWGLNHTGFAQNQTAYRVQVWQITSSGNVLSWDSGEVSSSHHHTSYGSVGTAAALTSDTSYTWVVSWWDSTGIASDSSEPAFFDTGILAQSQWTTSWVGGSGNLLRAPFSLTTAPTRARAYISGLGYYILYVNGQRVGDAQLDVGWTDYHKRCLYNAYDVTSLLQAGDNVIGVMQGHGWYSSSELQEPNGPRSVLFLLSVDGVITGFPASYWNISQGPVTYDGIYNGETYDARLTQPGWNAPGFDVNTSAWIPAVQVTSPGCILSYQTMPVVREKVIVAPQSITNPKQNIYVIDFGQNFSGYTRITIAGPSGSYISVQHAEVLLKDGSGLIYTANLRGALQTDKYIFNGSTIPADFQPHFTYHGFRYVQWNATNNPALVPTLSNIVGVHIYSDVASTGSISFTASNDILNAIQRNVEWGQRSNLMSVPTDCDQRDERKGWMGDAQLSAEEAIHNFYMPSFYINFLQDIKDEQDAAGTITDTAPFTFGNRPADPSWGSAYPSILYWIWKYYDDPEITAVHYTGVRSWINYLFNRYNSTGLRSLYSYYGDWVPPPPNAQCSSALCSSFSFLANLQQFIEIANATGHHSDANFYQSQLVKLQGQYNTAFLVSSSNYYDTGLQTPQALAFILGVVPAANRNAVIVNLLNNIITAKQTHLTTGIIGTKYLMLALHYLGRDDVALQLAEKLDYPSWGYMVYNPTEPATTVWELWDSPSGDPGMDSRNHIMFGSVSDWFYKALAGIDQVAGDVGFANFNIAPSVVGDLTGVSATFEAGMGNISVSWQKSGGATLCAAAPENHYAELDCSSVGSDGVIEEITFASFGLPRGTCSAFGVNTECHSPTSQEAVARECVGKKSCRILAHEKVMGLSKCTQANVFKRAHIQARCSVAAATAFNLNASIPVGSTANVVLPLLDLGHITVEANGEVVWAADSFIPSTLGISSGHRTGNRISLTTGSGDYSFELTGAPGTVLCASTTEGFNVNLTCPSANQIITQVQFASFGLPYGVCGNYGIGNCHAGSSVYVVETQCLLKNSCVFPVSNTLFQDPCNNTPKIIAVQVLCAQP